MFFSSYCHCIVCPSLFPSLHGLSPLNSTPPWTGLVLACRRKKVERRGEERERRENRTIHQQQQRSEKSQRDASNRIERSQTRSGATKFVRQIRMYAGEGDCDLNECKCFLFPLRHVRDHANALQLRCD